MAILSPSLDILLIFENKKIIRALIRGWCVAATMRNLFNYSGPFFA
jgi:hypothetical protein